MKNPSIVVFGASTSTKSINKKLATFAAKQLTDVDCQILDLNDYVCPLFSEDEEQRIGKSDGAEAFLTKLQSADGYIISLAEHNGNFPAAFKNLYDWVSRLERKMFGDKPMLLLSTSPGKFGGASVMEIAKAGFPRMGADIVSFYSLPRFNETFENDQIVEQEQLAQFNQAIEQFQARLTKTNQ